MTIKFSSLSWLRINVRNLMQKDLLNYLEEIKFTHARSIYPLHVNKSNLSVTDSLSVMCFLCLSETILVYVADQCISSKIIPEPSWINCLPDICSNT